MEHMYDVKKDSFPGISEEMNNRAKNAVDQTWQAIGDDCLVDDMGNPSQNSIRRSTMLELVSDAGHMETYGHDKEAAAYFIWLSRFHPTFYKKWIKEAFPFQWYGR